MLIGRDTGFPITLVVETIDQIVASLCILLVQAWAVTLLEPQFCN